MKTTLYLLFALAAFVVSCTMQISPDESEEATNEYDMTEYQGLYLYGSLKVDGYKAPDGDEIRAKYDEGYEGKLHLGDLITTLGSQCINEIIREQSGMVGGLNCFDSSNGDNPLTVASFVNYDESNFTGATSGKAKICAQTLYLCMGNKLMELGEAVAPTRIEANGLSYLLFKAQDSNYILSRFVWDNATNFYEYLGNSTPSIGDTGYCPKQKRCFFQYVIPPQSPENKTLAFLTAYKLFEYAGLSGSRLLHNPSERLLALSFSSANSLKSGTEPTTGAIFATQYMEVMEGITDALTKVKSNQTIVAHQSVGKIKDYKDAQESFWRKGLNSLTGALKIRFGQMSTVEQVPCGVDISKPTVRKAIRFLRVGRDADILTVDSESSARLLAKDTLAHMATDSSFPMSDDPEEQLEKYFLEQGFTVHDVHIAAKYLQDEVLALKRLVPIDPENSERLADISPLRNAPGAAYWYAQSIGMSAPSNTMDYENWYKAGPGVYPHRSAIELYSYLMDGALVLLDDNTISMDDEQTKMYASIGQYGRHYGGDRKVKISVGSGVGKVYGNNVSLIGNFNSENGVSTESLVVIRGEEGYWCASRGNVGGISCNISDFIVAEENAITSNDDPYGNPYTERHPFHQKISTRWRGSDKYYVYRRTLKEGYQLLTGYDAKSLAGSTIVVPGNGALISESEPIVERDPDNCGYRQYDCNDFPEKLVPPLENETIENGDQYENSWKVYLELARIAAARADELGEKLIQSGLDMDLRAEAAVTELEGICGGSINVGDIFGSGSCAGEEGCSVLEEFSSSDPSLQSCLPNGDDEYDYVSLGNELCLWKKNTAEKWCECPVGESCPSRCPIPMAPGKTCQAVFNGLGLDLEQDYEHIDVQKSLNLTRGVPPITTVTTETIETPCEQAARLREKFEDGTPIDETDWTQLLNWFNKRSIAAVQEKVQVRLDPFFHYTVLMDGAPLYSTFLDINGNLCPNETPWKPFDGTNNPEISCHHCDGSNDCGVGQELDQWIIDEFEFSNGGNTVYPVAERIKWGVKVTNVFKVMGLLAGSFKNFGYPAFHYRGYSNVNKVQSLDHLWLPGYTIPSSAYDTFPARIVDQKTVAIYADGGDPYQIPATLGGGYNLTVNSDGDTLATKLANLRLDRKGDLFNKTAWEIMGTMNREYTKTYCVNGAWITDNNCTGTRKEIFAFDGYRYFSSTDESNNLSYDVSFNVLDNLFDAEGDSKLRIKYILEHPEMYSSAITNQPDIEVFGDVCTDGINIGYDFKIKRSYWEDDEEHNDVDQNVNLCFSPQMLFDTMDFVCSINAGEAPSCSS
ncbi:MAG: hypothetical protein KJ630_19995, partial [Proteobacteria bacterium]|nr:hypothetical protein [Pseudomonadota bacterium]